MMLKKFIPIIIILVLLSSVCYAWFEGNKYFITNILVSGGNGSGGNSSFNQTLTDGLYLRLNQTNQQDIVSGTPRFKEGIHISKTAVAGSRTTLMYSEIDDSKGDFYAISDDTDIDGTFSPQFTGSMSTSSARSSLNFDGICNRTLDNSSYPLVTFSVYSFPDGDNALNPTTTFVTENRTWFRFRSKTTVAMDISKGLIDFKNNSVIGVKLGDLNTDGFVKTNMSNGTLYVDTNNYYLDSNPSGYYNITTLPQSGGGNASFNQTLTDSLYYSNTNPYGYYNWTNLPVGSYNSTMVDVYLSANQNIAAGTWTKILFDTEYIDRLGEFISGNFTPNMSGRYHFDVVTVIDTPVAAKSYTTRPTGGEGSAGFWVSDTASSTSNMYITTSGLVNLTAGQLFEIDVNCQDAQPLLSGGQGTRLAIYRVA